MSLPVSIVIPAYNAQNLIADVLGGIAGQDYTGRVELIVVNDGSIDDTAKIVEDFKAKLAAGSRDWLNLTLINQENQGAAAATNTGFRAAANEIVVSVDADVVLQKNWLSLIVPELDDPQVGAVQGYYQTPAGVSFWARMMGYDVEARYDAIASKYVTQVCTGDTAYRKVAVEKAGYFDPAFKYGYDNDMSYKLSAAGYKLVIRKDALCDHFWKEKLSDYLKQQYRSAYGRMLLLKRHKNKVIGDSVSGVRMMAQAPLTLLIEVLLIAAIAIYPFSRLGLVPLLTAAAAMAIMLVDRIAFALGIYKKQRDVAASCLPFIHLLRNVVWSFAIVRWSVKPR